MSTTGAEVNTLLHELRVLCAELSVESLALVTPHEINNPQRIHEISNSMRLRVQLLENQLNGLLKIAQDILGPAYQDPRQEKSDG